MTDTVEFLLNTITNYKYYRVEEDEGGSGEVEDEEEDDHTFSTIR